MSYIFGTECDIRSKWPVSNRDCGSPSRTHSSTRSFRQSVQYWDASVGSADTNGVYVRSVADRVQITEWKDHNSRCRRRPMVFIAARVQRCSAARSTYRSRDSGGQSLRSTRTSDVCGPFRHLHAPNTADRIQYARVPPLQKEIPIWRIGIQSIWTAALSPGVSQQDTCMQDIHVLRRRRHYDMWQ